MAAPRRRVRLEAGLKIDLNVLLRDGRVKRGQLGAERPGAAWASMSLEGSFEICPPFEFPGWFALKVGSLDQRGFSCTRRRGTLAASNCISSARSRGGAFPSYGCPRARGALRAGWPGAGGKSPRVAIRDAARSRSERRSGHSLRAWRGEFVSLDDIAPPKPKRNALVHL